MSVAFIFLNLIDYKEISLHKKSFWVEMSLSTEEKSDWLCMAKSQSIFYLLPGKTSVTFRYYY